MGFFQILQSVHLLLPKGHLAPGPGLFHVDEPLVAAAAKVQVQILLLLYERAVYQKVRFGQEGLYGRIPRSGQLLVGIAGVNHNVFTGTVDEPGKLRKGFGLTEGLTAA